MTNQSILAVRFALLIFALGCGLIKEAVAGPFGYDQGMTRETVQKISKKVTTVGDLLVVGQPPIPNEKILGLTLHFSKQSGLCYIHAAGKLFEPFDGVGTKHEFEQTLQVLSTKYGNPTVAFEPESHVREVVSPQDYYRAVSEQKGRLAAYWSSTREVKLPDNLRTVRLWVVEMSRPEGARGMLNLSYWFTNDKDCTQEQQRQRQRGKGL